MTENKNLYVGISSGPTGKSCSCYDGAGNYSRSKTKKIAEEEIEESLSEVELEKIIRR